MNKWRTDIRLCSTQRGRYPAKTAMTETLMIPLSVTINQFESRAPHAWQQNQLNAMHTKFGAARCFHKNLQEVIISTNLSIL